MKMEAFVRTELLLGREAIERLQQARVAVFGLGGVAATWWRRWRGAVSGRWI